ncbi:hypothetical protein Taro_047935, partial [Colocasia esculenta]|nr:hypothetical protein [Colocasia esculenta]
MIDMQFAWFERLASRLQGDLEKQYLTCVPWFVIKIIYVRIVVCALPSVVVRRLFRKASSVGCPRFFVSQACARGLSRYLCCTVEILVPRSATFSTCLKGDSDMMFWAIQNQSINIAQ